MKMYQLLVIATSFMLSCSEQATDGKEPTSSTLNANASRCALVPDTGPCKALLKRYYYDKAEGKCKEFNWGGCDGVVPFETLEECEKCKNN